MRESRRAAAAIGKVQAQEGLQCADHEQRLDQGDIVRLMLDSGRSANIQWRTINGNPDVEKEISISTPEELPVINLKN